MQPKASAIVVVAVGLTLTLILIILIKTRLENLAQVWRNLLVVTRLCARFSNELIAQPPKSLTQCSVAVALARC